MNKYLPGLMIILFISSTICFAQSQDSLSQITTPQKYTIENCVNSFDSNKTVPTKVGYQYWFADKDLADGKTLKMSVVAAHSATHAPHKHEEDEFFFVLEGTAEFHLEGKTAQGGPYTSFYCPSFIEHGIRNIGDTELKYLVIKKYIIK